LRPVLLYILLSAAVAQGPLALGGHGAGVVGNGDERTRAVRPRNGAVAAGARRNDRIPYKQLDWSDFRVDDAAPGLSAQTQTFLSYRYTVRAERPAQAVTFSATVARIAFTGGFDRARSWRRSHVADDNQTLLEHEQGHLDINELKLRQLKNLTDAEFPVGKGKTAKAAIADLDARLTKLYRWHLDDLEKTQTRYDKETNYGTRLAIQGDWTLRLRRAIVATEE
jgi:hypothetical protein